MKTTFQPARLTAKRPGTTQPKPLRFGSQTQQAGLRPADEIGFSDILKANKSQAEALFRYTAEIGNTDVLAKYLDAGLNIDAQSNYGNTALMGAAAYGQTNTLKFLIKNGANINHQNVLGETAAVYSANHGQLDTLETLIQAGADLNIPNDSGKTPAMYAVEGNRLFSLSKLITAGANLNLQTNFHRNTAAILAAIKRNLPAMTLLKYAGTDLGIKNQDGETALDIAKENGFTEIVDLIQQQA